MKTDAGYEEVTSFHGHSCPGLALGYRVATAAVAELGLSRSNDEEVVAIVENSACGVDAVQFVLGCTFGKGNLFHKDYGKHAFTFIRRDTGKAIRITADFLPTPGADQERISVLMAKSRAGGTTPEENRELAGYRAAKVKSVLEAPAEDFLTIKPASPEIPPKATVVDSVICDGCGEKVMSTKTELADGKRLCIPCRESKL